jgi:acetylornithine deacetylase/succinyl-diaminopimelate desuccinylase-like protein
MATREGAVAQALSFFDNGFRDRLAELVAIPSTSQDPGHEVDVQYYLDSAIRPWLERLGFQVAIHPNPQPGFGPILTANRHEDASRPTVLTYGHGDTVRGLEDQWRAGLDPWRLTEQGDRWYGRGTADNKGQHALNLSALEAVLAERGGKLGCNLKLVLETSEERGSIGLRDFVAAHKDELAADVLIGSDGPRVMPEVPTIATGTRGTFHFDLAVDLWPGGVHSGLGRLDHRPRRGTRPRTRRDHRPQRPHSGARLATRDLRVKPGGKRRASQCPLGTGRLRGRRWR